MTWFREGVYTSYTYVARIQGCTQFELLPRDNCACLLVERLNAGRTIGMIVDRPVDGGKPTPFFGREKSTTIMPAKLALKFDGDMIPAQVRHANPGDCKNDQAIDRYDAPVTPIVRKRDPTAPGGMVLLKTSVAKRATRQP